MTIHGTSQNGQFREVGNMVEVVNLWNLEIAILKNYHADNGQLIEVVKLEAMCAFTAGLLNCATCLSYIHNYCVHVYIILKNDQNKNC